MWDTPFDEGMLNAKPGVAIYCPEDSLAEELFQIFRENGLGKRWNAGISGGRVYCVSDKDLKYGSKNGVEEIYPYSSYIKCTFYGETESTFEPAGDSELLAFLGL